MSLLFIVGLWLFLGGAVYRAHKRQSTPGDRVPGCRDVGLGHRRVHAEIPNTVPSDWVESYRSENGG